MFGEVVEKQSGPMVVSEMHTVLYVSSSVNFSKKKKKPKRQGNLFLTGWTKCQCVLYAFRLLQFISTN